MEEDESAARPSIPRREALLGGAALTLLAGGVVAAFAERQTPVGRTAGRPAGRRADSGSRQSTTLGNGATADAGAAHPLAGSSPSATSGHASAHRRVLTEAERRLHLARRLTLGPTPQVLDDIGSMGESAWVDQQLAPGTIDDRDAEAAVASLDLLDRSAAEIAAAEAGDNRLLRRTPAAPHAAIQQLRHAAVLRAVLSRRQLNELVVDMWTDHFAIQLAGLDGTQEYVVHDRDVVRRHALSRFEDLLRAVAHSPAMLRALDNHLSVAAAPNENFARELLELHTLGPGSFSEADVKSAARVFTGWTIDDRHLFKFDPSTHHVGPAEVAGWRSDGAGGVRDGDSLLGHLAAHPATARMVAMRLCRRLVADDPPSAVIDAAARSYLQSGTSIATTIRTIVSHEAFWTSYDAKSRRGFELAASMLRSCRARISSDATSPGARTIETCLVRLGQRPFDPPSPEGLPDTRASWATESFVLARWNMALRLLVDEVPGVDPDVDGIFGAVEGKRAGDALREILEQVVPGAATAAHVPVLLHHFAISPDAPLPVERIKRAELLALCVSVPEMQVR